MAIDLVVSKYPDAEVIGVDLSLIQPKWYRYQAGKKDALLGTSRLIFDAGSRVTFAFRSATLNQSGHWGRTHSIWSTSELVVEAFLAGLRFFGGSSSIFAAPFYNFAFSG
jgi:membrane-bound metal-dependent hydrolase YbcI (DUF457 family)